MSDITIANKRQAQTLIVLWVNFALFIILFSGLGFLIWQSATLVIRLREDLEQAEQTVAELRTRVESMDTEAIVHRVLAAATEELDESIRSAIQESDLADTLEAIQGIYESVGGLDPEEMARAVSSNILLGLSDGIRDAAQAQNPRPSQ